MKISPLQVKHYHFLSLSVAARLDVKIEETPLVSDLYPAIDSENLHTEVFLGDGEGDDPHQFAVMLEVKYSPDDKSNFPYTFSVGMEGVFVIDHDGDIQERRNLVVCNGASMLYGAAREQLLMLTARHRFGPMMLPSANFRGLVPEEKKKPKSAARKAKPKISVKK